MKTVRLTTGQHVYDRAPAKDAGHKILGALERDVEVDVVQTENGNALVRLDDGRVGYVPLTSITLPAATAADRIRGVVGQHFRAAGDHGMAALVDPAPPRKVPLVDGDGQPVTEAPAESPPRSSNPVNRLLRATGRTQ